MEPAKNPFRQRPAARTPVRAPGPARDSARIRGFFVRPDWARHGIGRAIIERCEAEALADGFGSTELLATLPWHRLYRAFGYSGDERGECRLPGGVVIEFIPMRKDLL